MAANDTDLSLADLGAIPEGAIENNFETPLSPDEEKSFRSWKHQNAPEDSGEDYDFRGAFKAGLKPDANGHWSDRFKKPNHPTFSDESVYAAVAPGAGHWEGDRFIPPSDLSDLGAVPEIELAEQPPRTSEELGRRNIGLQYRFAGQALPSGMTPDEAWQAGIPKPEEAETPTGSAALQLAHDIPRAAIRGGQALLAVLSDVAAVGRNITTSDRTKKLPVESLKQFADQPTEPLPAEVGAEEMTGAAGFGERALQSTIKFFPGAELSGLVATPLETLGLSENVAGSLAGAGVFGMTEKGFDPKTAAVMAAFPWVSTLGARAGAGLAAKIAGDSVGAKKAAEWLGGLAATQAWMDLTSLPDYLTMKPEDAWREWSSNFGLNLANHLIGLPGVVKDARLESAVKNTLKEQLDNRARDTFWQNQEAAKAGKSPEDWQNILNSIYGGKPPAQSWRDILDEAYGRKGEDAEGVRSDTGQPTQAGQVVEGGEANRGGDVEQAPPEQPKPVEQGKGPRVENAPEEEKPNAQPVGIDTGRNKNMPGWVAEEMKRRGLQTGRIFNDVDLANPSIREAIQSDPTLSQEQKDSLLKTGALPVPPSALTPEQQAQSKANNSRAAFEALAANSGQPLPVQEKRPATPAKPVLDADQLKSARAAIGENMQGREMEFSGEDLYDKKNPHLAKVVKDWNSKESVLGTQLLPKGLTWVDLANSGVVQITQISDNKYAVKAVQPRAAPQFKPAAKSRQARISTELIKPSGFVPPPEPERFETAQDVLDYRELYKSAEIAFYRSLGITEQEAEKLFRAADARSNLDASKIEEKLTPENLAKLDMFSTGEGSQMYQWDRAFNPEDIEAETNNGMLAQHIVSAISKQGEMKAAMGDRFLSSVIALRRLKDQGGTWSDIARELDKYSTRNSQSQSDKTFLFRHEGTKLKAFADSQGITLEQGDLGSRITGETQPLGTWLQWHTNEPETPKASFGGAVRRSIRPGIAVGVEETKRLFSDPENGLDPFVAQVWTAILNQPVMRDLDWSRLNVLLDPRSKDFRGEAWIANSIIRLSGTATADTFPHEVFHFLYELLPEDYRQAIEQMRLDELHSKYGDTLPPHMEGGRITSDEFRQLQKQGLASSSDYRLTTGSEYLAHFAGQKFVADQFENRAGKSAGWWDGFKTKLQGWVRAIVSTVRRLRRGRPDMEDIYNELLAGQWKPTAESGEAAEKERRLSLATTEEEYQKQRTFGDRGAAERAAAAYADIATLKGRMADELKAGPKARDLIDLPRDEQLAISGSRDANYTRRVFGNYQALRDRVARSDIGLRSQVVIDAWRGLGNEQANAINVRSQFDDQRKLVESKAFQTKMDRLWERKLTAEYADVAMETYRNRIAKEAGDVLRELNEKGKTDAAYDQLRSDLVRLGKMPEYSQAVAQRVQDIIDVVSAADGGMDLLFSGEDKTGDKIYRTYLDLKQQTATPGPRIPPVDPSLLSAEDRARIEAAKGVPLTGDQQVFAKLASALLAVNTDLRLRMASLAHLKQNPQFRAEVTEIGERFRRSFENNPNTAISAIARAISTLRGRQINAENAWLRLHREIIPEIEQYQTLREAVGIYDRLEASDDWKSLVNQIHQDAQAVRIPDSELRAGATAQTVWNEFVGRGELRSPSGGIYEYDLGFTKKSAQQARAVLTNYLGDLSSWLDDPANAQSPDRRWWQMKYDFVDSVLNVSTVLNPTATDPLVVKNPWTIPEFFFKTSGLPQVKLAATASSNFTRAWVMADQWYNGAEPDIMRSLRAAAKSHGINADTSIHDYQRKVLNRLASEYRNGRALKAGDTLNNGVKLTQADMVAFQTMGRLVKQRFDAVNNLAREKVMADGLMADQWEKNVFGLRAPQELGVEAGTTLPHEFSTQARALARAVNEITAGNYSKLIQLFDQPEVFNEFVSRWLAERRADYSTETPFEGAFKELARKIEAQAPDRPKSVADILNYIHSNFGDEHEMPQIVQTVVGGMEGELRKFYKQFVEPADKGAGSDVRVLRATDSNAFTGGFQRDVGSSFYYDYSAVTSPEIRSLAIDSTNFHLVRLARSLDALVSAYDAGIAEMEKGGPEEKKAVVKAGMAAFRSGEDFRNWERLYQERKIAKYFRDGLAKAYGGQGQEGIALFGQLARLQGDFIGSTLSGLGTMSNVLIGSPMKMALVLGAMERSYWTAYPKALLSTLYSLAQYERPVIMAGARAVKAGYKAFVESPEQTIRGRLGDGFVSALQEVTENLFRQSQFFDDQYAFGLGTKNPVGQRISNILAMPSSHGRGYDPRLSDNPVLAAGQKALYRALAVAEAPLELVKAIFPQFGYVVSYDAAARMAGGTIDGMAAQARRYFEWMERTGRLGQFDLKYVKNPRNIVTADMIVPRGIFAKGQTQLNFARDWWSRAIDLPLPEMVLNYWAKLAQTPKDRRGEVSFLASDASDEQRQKVEDARAGALFSVLVKDVHHASPENRPMYLRISPEMRYLLPLVGWFSHSTRGTAQYLGRAVTDLQRTRAQIALMAAATIGSVFGVAVLAGEAEKGIKYLLSRYLYHEVPPFKFLPQAGGPAEAAKIAAVDSTSFVPLLHAWVASLLGEQYGGTGQGGVSIFTMDKINALLHYFSGVRATGSPTYGLAALAKMEIPLSKALLNQLDSQKGLIAERNARELMRLYGPPDLVRSETGGVAIPTQLTPIRQDLANAIFSGDVQGQRIAAQQFTSKAQQMGKSPEEAERMLHQVVASLNPYQQVFGQKLTDEQRQAFISNLGQGWEASQVDDAEKRWTAAEGMLGTGVGMTKGESGARGGQISVPHARRVSTRLRVSGRRPAGSRLRVSYGRLPHVTRLRAARRTAYHRLANIKNRLRLSRRKRRVGV